MKYINSFYDIISSEMSKYSVGFNLSMFIFNKSNDYVDKIKSGIVFYRKVKSSLNKFEYKQILYYIMISDIRIHTHMVK